VPRKICFKHTIKTKIVPPKNVLRPPKPYNLATGRLVICQINSEYEREWGNNGKAFRVIKQENPIQLNVIVTHFLFGFAVRDQLALSKLRHFGWV